MAEQMAIRTNDTTKLDRTMAILDRLIPVHDKLEEQIAAKNKFQLLLLEPRLLIEYRRDWISFYASVKLRNYYRDNKIIDPGAVRDSIVKIGANSKKFAGEVYEIVSMFKVDANIFAGLFGALREGKDFFVSYISTHLDELNAKAKSIHDEKLSRKLIPLFSSISGHEIDYLEIDYLIRYKEDCKNWEKYARYYDAVNYGINFFIRKVNYYFAGGFERDVQYKGLYKDFGDGELALEIVKNDAIKNLRRYNRQLKYLESLINLCKISEKSGKWEGFWGRKGFWTDFKKYAKKFEKTYGNAEFTKLLMSQKDKIRENPEGWGGLWKGDNLVKDGFLPQLLRKLRHPSYQRQKIILPASSALHEILNKREEELRAGRERHIKELMSVLQELTGAGIARKKVVSRLNKLLKRKRKALMEELNDDVSNFLKHLEGPLGQYNSFSENFSSSLARVAPELLDRWELSLIENASEHLAHLRQQVTTGNVLKGMSGLVRADVASSVAARSEDFQIGISKYEHLREEDFQRMEGLIPTAHNVIGTFAPLLEFINLILKQKYTIKIESLRRLRYRTIRNKDFSIGYVRKVAKRLT